MTTTFNNFLDQCLRGDALASDIDDAIDAWHESSTPLELHEYLGMTFTEYVDWVKNPNVLNVILFSRRANVPYERAKAQLNAEGQTFDLAARAPSLDEADVLLKWLHKQEKI
jgi:hypothetical protein